jgi:hypothetical protein
MEDRAFGLNLNWKKTTELEKLNNYIEITVHISKNI